MKITWLIFFSFSFIIIGMVRGGAMPPYFDENDQGYPLEEDEYPDNSIDTFLKPAQKRGCVRRGGNCDYRPNDCCYNSSCRCNLWGANCRCQHY